MIIKKFGGSSIGSPSRMREVLSLVKLALKEDQQQCIIVLSAIGGVTDKLEKFSLDHNKSIIEELKIFYLNFVSSLFKGDFLIDANKIIEKSINDLALFASQSLDKSILAQGELVSTKIFNLLAYSEGMNPHLFNALDVLKLKEDEKPDYNFAYDKIKITELNNSDFGIIQGYICRNFNGEIDNLKRGGSDYSAAIYGAALNAERIEIWSDIDGVHNCDPRYVENTKPISELDYEEAAEMAYFGAKVLHPSTILPAKEMNIPVLLKNTLRPEKPGTLIHSFDTETGIRAIAAKDNISVIRIQSDRMLMAYGFLSKVFEVFSKYKTPIDMITTSEVAVAMTIDDDSKLEEIISELKDLGNVEIEKNQCIVSVIGKMQKDDSGYGNRVFNALEDIPISMISYGASEHNISILIKSIDKVKSLKTLHSII